MSNHEPSELTLGGFKTGSTGEEQVREHVAVAYLRTAWARFVLLGSFGTCLWLVLPGLVAALWILVSFLTAGVVTVRERRSNRVLVVDDDATNRRVLESFAQREGCAVNFAEDGLEAVECSRNQVFDVVFMDLSMPNMDGIEAAQAIRANEAADQQPAVPIVCLTAHAMQHQREQWDG